MNAMDILTGLNDVRDRYITDTAAFRQETPKQRQLPRKRLWLIAAIVALALLLVGCAVAYASGWFQILFSARSETPLSPDQVQYIQQNEQTIAQVQAKDGWTIDLKSSISDGTVGYLVFRVTAPGGIDLEQYLNQPAAGSPRLIPGNYSLSHKAAYSMVIASIGTVDRDQNYMYQEHGSWLSDNDGQPNTALYCMTIQCDKIYPEKPMQLEAPFGKDISFRIRFMGLTLEYTDTAVQESIEANHSDQESYIVDGEEAAGLFRSDILTDEEWNFEVTFDPGSQFIELIRQPVTAQAIVTYAPDDAWAPAVQKQEPVQIESFRVTPFGAEVRLETMPDMHTASLDLSSDTGSLIYAVTKDGSRIPLQESSQRLLAQTPIVLEQLDYVLLADGTKLPVPGN